MLSLLPALLAQTDPDGIALFAQYGVLGVAVFALAMFARQAYNREKERADRSEAKLELLLENVQKEYTPTVVRANDLMTNQMVPLLLALKDLPRLLEEIRLDMQADRRGETQRRTRQS